jgi:hypothetical protein
MQAGCSHVEYGRAVPCVIARSSAIKHALLVLAPSLLGDRRWLLNRQAAYAHLVSRLL